MKVETSESIQDVLERIKILELKMNLLNRRPEDLIEAALQTYKSKLMKQIDSYIEDAFAKHLLEFMKLAKGVTLGLEKVEKKVASLEAKQTSLFKTHKPHKLADNATNRKSSDDLLGRESEPKYLLQDSPKGLLKPKPLSEVRHAPRPEADKQREVFFNEFMCLEVPKSRVEKEWEDGLDSEEGFLWGKEMNSKVKYFEADSSDSSMKSRKDQEFEFILPADNKNEDLKNSR